MASASTAKKMREEATCSICLNLMAEPVSISCGHSYCHLCLVGFLDNLCYTQPQLAKFSCPQCRAPFRRASLRPNKQLGSLIDAVKELDQEAWCREHGEQLQLFCEDDGQLICWLCERVARHRGHSTALVEDASQGYRVRGALRGPRPGSRQPKGRGGVLKHGSRLGGGVVAPEGHVEMDRE